MITLNILNSNSIRSTAIKPKMKTTIQRIGQTFTLVNLSSITKCVAFILTYYSNVAAIKVLEAQIPFTFYVFNSKNNTFLLTESYGGGARTVTIPPGNYTQFTLPSVLQTALQTASANGWGYSVTYSQATNKLTITGPLAGSFPPLYFTLTFGTNIYDNGRTNPRLALGFSGGPNVSGIGATSSSIPAILVAPSVLQLSGPNYVYLNSTTLGGNVHLFLPGNGIVNPSGAGADGPQIAKIPMCVNPGEIFNWNDPNPLMWFDVGNTNFNGNIDFYLTLGTESMEEPLELNGAAFSIKLGILSNQESHNNWLGGGRQNERAIVRSYPTGMY